MGISSGYVHGYSNCLMPIMAGWRANYTIALLLGEYFGESCHSYRIAPSYVSLHINSFLLVFSGVDKYNLIWLMVNSARHWNVSCHVKRFEMPNQFSVHRWNWVHPYWTFAFIRLSERKFGDHIPFPTCIFCNWKWQSNKSFNCFPDLNNHIIIELILVLPLIWKDIIHAICICVVKKGRNSWTE